MMLLIYIDVKLMISTSTVYADASAYFFSLHILRLLALAPGIVFMGKNHAV